MKKKVVVMGGGTGTFPVVAGLKREELSLSAVIAVSDSGGSTGRIRDEFGFPPVGDLRQGLAALAESKGEKWIREILLYRFQKGAGLKGHNVGNLILTALQDMTGDTGKALEILEKVFRLKGQVIPATPENVQLEIHYQDGSTQIGEHILDDEVREAKKIAKVELVPAAKIHPKAADAIKNADLIIIGPGDYYGSIMAALVPTGIKDAFATSRAKVVYIVNLMTRFTQTHEMTAGEHLAGIEAVIGKKVDFVVMNSGEIPEDVIAHYALGKEYPVVDDLEGDPRVIRQDLLSTQVYQKSATDTAHRSLLRHDKDKLRQVLVSLLPESPRVFDSPESE